MIRVLITDGIDKKVVEILRSKGFEVVEQFYEEEELKKQIKEFDCVVVRSATKIRVPILDAAAETGRLKLIIRGGVGIDNIDAEYARGMGITVTNTPNASSASVAELAIGHMFSIARYMHIANHTMRLGKWDKKLYVGTELYGKTLGLIGSGRIALETAKRASALGMKVVYTNRSGEKAEFAEHTFASLDVLLKVSDFISLHVPGAKDKKTPLIAAEQFSLMKDGVFLINTARGGVVDEEALLDALDSGKVAGAALDVFAEEPTKNERIYTHERISLTPHVGAQTNEAQERVGAEVGQIILKFFN